MLQRLLYSAETLWHRKTQKPNPEPSNHNPKLQERAISRLRPLSAAQSAGVLEHGDVRVQLVGGGEALASAFEQAVCAAVARCCDTILSTEVLSTGMAPLSPLANSHAPAPPHLVDDALSLSSTASSLSPASRLHHRPSADLDRPPLLPAASHAPAQPAADERSDHFKPWRQASAPAMSDAPRVLAVALSKSFNSSLSLGNGGNVPGSCSPKVLFSLQRVRGHTLALPVSSGHLEIRRTHVDFPGFYLTESVYKFVLQQSIPAQICRLILQLSNSKG